MVIVSVILSYLASLCDAVAGGDPDHRRYPLCEGKVDADIIDGRISVETATCALRCAEDEPVLDMHLRPWAKEEILLPVETVEKFCNLRDGTLTVVVALVNGTAYWKKCHDDGDSDLCMNPQDDYHTRAWLHMVQEIAAAVQLPDLLFMMQCSDQPAVEKREYDPYPVFHSEGGYKVWNIPWLNPYHLRGLYNGDLDKRVVPVAWDMKVNKVYWRGTLCMPSETPVSKASRVPRIRVFHKVKKAPNLFDVAITGIDDDMDEQWGKGVTKRVAKKHGVRRAHSEPFMEHGPRFKYVLNIDGVISSWRLTTMLATGSVLLLQNSSSYEALKPLLKPWVHFVPVKRDLSDLVEVAEYLEAHPQEAKSIAAAGLELYRGRVRTEDTYCLALRSLVSLVGRGQAAGRVIGNEAIRRLQLQKAPNAASLMKRHGDFGKSFAGLRQRLKTSVASPVVEL